MAFRRAHIRKIFVPAPVFLVLSVIVVAELPELLTLTDDTTNDLTVRKANIVVLRVLPDVSKYGRMSDVVPTSEFVGA